MNWTRACAVVLGTALLEPACGLESGTGGELIDFEFSLGVTQEVSSSFETRSGWMVTLDTAQIAVGPAWLYENPPAVGGELSPDWLASFGELVLPSAWAHPGDAFFNGGQLRGEFLEQHVYDLVTGELTSLGEARGVAGQVGTMTLVLDPPSTAIEGDASLLADHPLWVAGQAQRENEMGVVEVVNFAGGLELDEDERELSSITANFDLAAGDGVILRIDARSWFDEAQFDRLEVEGEDGVMLIDAESQVALAWKLAVRNATNYQVRHAPAP